MIFTETKLKGAFVIDVEKRVDDRGFFARTFCRKEFESKGLKPDLVQSSISYNKRKGTLRGLHYQAVPHQETKIVCCIRGAVWDVIVDLRPKSATYCRWFGVELKAEDYKMLYIPEGFAHGFKTLKRDTLLLYHMSEFFHPESAQGIRWDDPLFGIRWPEGKTILSEKDRGYPDFKK